MNTVLLVGFVGQSPKTTYLNDGQKMVTFSLATSENYKNKAGEKVEKTEWHNIVCYRYTADLVDRYVGKGDRLALRGKLQYSQYEKNGIKMYSSSINIDHVEFLSSRNNSTAAPQTQQPQVSRQRIEPSSYGPENPNDLPF